MSMDRAKLEADHQRDRFEHHLRQFVRKWTPKDPFNRQEMQSDLCMLMRDAMQAQAATLSYGVEMYAASTFHQMALQPLCVIFEKPEKEPG